MRDDLIARLERRAGELDEFPFDAYQDTAKLLREAIAALTAQGETAPRMELDNHHNALLCPYCNPERLRLCSDPAAHAQGEIAPAPGDLGPHPNCRRCRGTGECDNAQFQCPCRWSTSPYRRDAERQQGGEPAPALVDEQYPICPWCDKPVIPGTSWFVKSQFGPSCGKRDLPKAAAAPLPAAVNGCTCTTGPEPHSGVACPVHGPLRAVAEGGNVNCRSARGIGKEAARRR